MVVVDGSDSSRLGSASLRFAFRFVSFRVVHLLLYGTNNTHNFNFNNSNKMRNLLFRRACTICVQCAISGSFILVVGQSFVELCCARCGSSLIRFLSLATSASV